MKSEIYISVPKKYIETTYTKYPVFSDTDQYIENYNKISNDHLLAFESEGINPFMAEDFWNECYLY